MDILNSFLSSFTTPMFLAFALGIFATRIKSDLKFPEGMYIGLTVYLLFGIGLKGGYKLSKATFGELYLPIFVAVIMCVAIPIWSYYLLKKIGKFDVANSAAIAAHYGSVSAVTFSECLAFMELMQVPFEGFMPSLMAIMEVPAILIALFFAKTQGNEEKEPWGKVLHELFAGKGTVLLIGGMVIGAISGQKGFEAYSPLFDAPFRGILVLFLLEVGLVTGRRLEDLKKLGPFLLLFAIVVPLFNAIVGIYLAKWAGLSLGGATIFGTLCASASYIAAPTAVRLAIPSANPSFYLTASLAVTFPFNISIGLPLYLETAKYVFGGN